MSEENLNTDKKEVEIVEKEVEKEVEILEKETDLISEESLENLDETQDTSISTDIENVEPLQDNFYSEYSNKIQTTIKILRESLDKVYQMRTKAAELDLELNTIYIPNLLKKIEEANQMLKEI